jgi:hypothetical protein
MWVALAALVVFVFPSLIVLLVDERDPAIAEPELRSSPTESSPQRDPSNRPPANKPTETVRPTPSDLDVARPADAPRPTEPPAPSAVVVPNTAAPNATPARPPIDLPPPIVVDRPELDADRVPPAAKTTIAAWLGIDEALADRFDRAVRRAASEHVQLAQSPPQKDAPQNPPAHTSAPPSNVVATEPSNKAGTVAPDAAEVLRGLTEPRETPVAAPSAPPDASNPASSVDEFRTWTDVTGKYRVVARIVGVEKNVVKLLKENGHISSVPIAKLSKDDRDYIARWLSAPH